MPISQSFARRLFPILPKLAEEFGTPFHICDEEGIDQTCRGFNRAFRNVPGFRQHYAVKALANPEILKLMPKHGHGFDCSCPFENNLAIESGASNHEDIIFTSNDTTEKEFELAIAAGAIINIDDVSLIRKVPRPFPELICFRYNPGRKRKGNSIIGKPEEAKYGIMDSEVVPAYKEVERLGAKRFGIQSMICSNQRDYRYIIETVLMLLRQCERLEEYAGIRCEFADIGGGFGIAYKPGDSSVDIVRIGEETANLIDKFNSVHGWYPKIFTECGRFITGPHGLFVTRVINCKRTYEIHVGVEAAMTGLMRPAIYGAYHHITIRDENGRSCENRKKEVVNVVGPICENWDRLATQRVLPVTREGDFVVTHDTGAHGSVMCFNYGSRPRHQQLLLRKDGSVERTMRAETDEDLRATMHPPEKIWRSS